MSISGEPYVDAIRTNLHEPGIPAGNRENAMSAEQNRRKTELVSPLDLPVERGHIHYGVLTTSPIFYQKIQYIIKKKFINAQVSLVTWDNAFGIAEQMYQNGVHAFISGLAMASELRRLYPIPVLSLPVNLDDIIYNLQEAKQYADEVLIVLFRTNLDCLDILEHMFSMRIVQKSYSSIDELYAIVKEWSRQGHKVIIGGASSGVMAKNLGLISIHYHISVQSLYRLMENSEQVIQKYIHDQNMTRQYQSIINAIPDGYVSITGQGIIKICNQKASQIFGAQSESIVGRPISLFIPDRELTGRLTDDSSQSPFITTINARKYMVRLYPLHTIDGDILFVISLRTLSSVTSDTQQIQKILTAGLVARHSLEEMVHQSPQMKQIVHRIRNYAQSDSSVLIHGESGTGKEIVAHSIHNLSPRRDGPFVSINCASIPEQLLESELFGYEEGAFTGARRGGKIGLLELAHNGSFFFDEINSLPLHLQGKLLRAIETREIMRVGGSRVSAISVRIIAACNRDMAEQIRDGKFREDLFFRLNILNIHIPPLRERPSDIPLLVQTLLQRHARSRGLTPPVIPPDSLTRLQHLPWRGNIRQLSGFLERFLLLCGPTFADATFNTLLEEETRSQGVLSSPPQSVPLPVAGASPSEQENLLTALEASHWNKSRAARKLGISRVTLHRKLKKFSILPE